jgi:hypothetical protein
MATFEITAPDGETYEVEGATQEGAVAALKKMLGQSAPSEDRSKWGMMGNINNVVNQIGTGLFKGLAGVAALPRTLSDLTADNSTTPRHAVAGRAIPGAAEYVKQKFGPSKNPGQYLPSMDDIIGYLEMIPGMKMAPAETRGDKFLQAGGMGASGAFMPGPALPNFVGGMTGSVASEGAGQLTEGTALEPYARIAAGLVGGVAGSMGVNRLAASNAEQLISRATQGVTPDQWAAAMRLQSEAARRGAPITSAEALAQVQGGNRTLMSIQRTTEQMPDSAPQMDRFMAARPGGNAAAVGGQLDSLAPQRLPGELGDDVRALGERNLQVTHGPAIEAAEQRALRAERGIGPRMTREEAGGVIQRELRQGADTADAYRANASGPQFMQARSSDAVVNTDPVTAIAAGYMRSEKGRLQDLAQEALATMRVGGRIAGAPDTSVSGLMASRKALGDMISAESRAGNNEAVRMLTDIRRGLDDALAEVPDVARANDTYSLLSREVTDRFEGPTVGPIVERDQFNRNLVMPPEQVPAKITAGGATGVDEFTQAATGRSYEAYRQYLTREIVNKALGPNGNVNADLLRKVLNENDEILNRFPEIRQRFGNVLSAQSQVNEARTIMDEARRTKIGSLAETSDWEKQVGKILDDAPGSDREAAALVRRLSAADPEGGAQRLAELFRTKIEDTFNKSLPNAKGTGEQYRGANFAGKLSANPQSMRTLEAAIRALPNGETQWTGFRRLLDVFEAQGQRLLPGSPTSFNQQLAGTLEKNLGKGVKSLGTDIWANWNVQRRSQELAHILTAPEGVALLRQLAVTGPNTARAQQLVQGFYQGAQGARSSEQPRSLQQTR